MWCPLQGSEDPWPCVLQGQFEDRPGKGHSYSRDAQTDRQGWCPKYTVVPDLLHEGTVSIDIDLYQQSVVKNNNYSMVTISLNYCADFCLTIVSNTFLFIVILLLFPNRSAIVSGLGQLVIACFFIWITAILIYFLISCMVALE